MGVQSRCPLGKCGDIHRGLAFPSAGSQCNQFTWKGIKLSLPPEIESGTSEKSWGIVTKCHSESVGHFSKVIWYLLRCGEGGWAAMPQWALLCNVWGRFAGVSAGSCRPAPWDCGKLNWEVGNCQNANCKPGMCPTWNVTEQAQLYIR